MKDKDILNGLRKQEGIKSARWDPLLNERHAAELVEKYALNVTWKSTHTGRVWRAYNKDMDAVDPLRNRAICLAVLR